MPADTTVPYLEIPPTFVFIFEKVFFVFSAVTVPFYTCIIVILIKAQVSKNPNLSNPFFKLCISSGIIDIVNILNNYVCSVFPKWGLFPSFYKFLGSPYLHLYFFIAWSAGVCQAISVSVLATNRLSAILYPHKYAKMWYGNRLKLAIIMQFVPGMLMASPTLLNDVVLMETGDSLIPKIVNPRATTFYFTSGGFFLFGNSLYLIIAYAFLLKTLHRRHKEQRGVKREEEESSIQAIAKRRERRLFTMSLCIVIVQLIILCFFSLKVVAVVRLTLEQFYMFYNALSDVYSGVNPYLLWIFSDVLRDHIYKTLGMAKKQEKTQMIVSFTVRPDIRTNTPIAKQRNKQ